ncbi:hypothetical protein EDD27_4362 [Nonomuraea polychroma]|uniref:DUF4190 domain-containing protein n=1 Tax=Nonomuraea polychroma TaxID=46176 RepID=A0A438M7U6_9ACTN|nr:hypothetical protein [Nonomuraea polychroma]RVX41791.1 hypothetical protein EDD27_4362 [Nonomuraea polychroma]
MTSPQDSPPGDDRRTGAQPPRRPPPGRRAIDQVLSIVGFVCAAVSVLFSPILFGLAGIALGIAGHAKGEPLGKWAAAAAGAGMVVGTVLSFALESIVS